MIMTTKYQLPIIICLNMQMKAKYVATRDVRNRFFNFGSVLEKNSDLVRNEFGSVRFAKTRFGSDNYLLLM